MATVVMTETSLERFFSLLCLSRGTRLCCVDLAFILQTLAEFGNNILDTPHPSGVS